MNKTAEYMKQSVHIIRFLLSLVIVFGILTGCTGQPAAPTAIPFPTHQISLVIPFDPGGPSDKIVQQLIPGLKSSLGQDIVTDYKVGGGGATGWTEVAKSTPDGYSVVIVNLPHIVIQPLYGKVGYKTEQLDVIAVLARTPTGLAVLKSSPYNTLQEFIAAAKTDPGKIKLGLGGELGTQHIAALLLQKLTGTKFNFVFYTGSAPELNAMLGGEISAVIGNTDDFIKYKDQVKVLALANDARFPALPDAPTFKEQGLDLVATTDRGVAVAAGTPDAIVRKLEAAFMSVAKTPEFQAAMKKQGFAQVVMGRDETKAYIDQLIVTYKQLSDFIK
jgi:tripartite-type tricarboxylate transporter receptor subunit TctC